jgi:hypothetical protein
MLCATFTGGTIRLVRAVPPRRIPTRLPGFAALSACWNNPVSSLIFFFITVASRSGRPRKQHQAARNLFLSYIRCLRMFMKYFNAIRTVSGTADSGPEFRSELRCDTLERARMRLAPRSQLERPESHDDSAHRPQSLSQSQHRSTCSALTRTCRYKQRGREDTDGHATPLQRSDVQSAVPLNRVAGDINNETGVQLHWLGLEPAGGMNRHAQPRSSRDGPATEAKKANSGGAYSDVDDRICYAGQHGQ